MTTPDIEKSCCEKCRGFVPYKTVVPLRIQDTNDDIVCINERCKCHMDIEKKWRDDAVRRYEEYADVHSEKNFAALMRALQVAEDFFTSTFREAVREERDEEILEVILMLADEHKDKKGTYGEYTDALIDLKKALLSKRAAPPTT